MSMITPPGGWGSGTEVRPPSAQVPQTYVQAPYPQSVVQQVVIVQTGPQGPNFTWGFLGWLCLILFFPLWPITIPIAIVVWIASLSRRSAPAVTYRVH